jgi:hypothetical protein
MNNLGTCYSLGNEWPPKTHVLKAWSSAPGAIRTQCDLLEVGPSGRMLGHWWHTLKGAIVTLAPVLFIFIP